MNTLEKALKRSRIPDCSSGPMSLAKEDRRVLADEVERLGAEKAWLSKRVTTLESDRTALADHVGEDQAVDIIQAATAAKEKP